MPPDPCARACACTHSVPSTCQHYRPPQCGGTLPCLPSQHLRTTASLANLTQEELWLVCLSHVLPKYYTLADGASTYTRGQYPLTFTYTSLAILWRVLLGEERVGSPYLPDGDLFCVS
ncbi:hypothetical protein MLD38_033433 [Melastoma candidum]|uniref:Uncharacterized protein n=1 Tax=Melastoma candidum TaxID=119954 RepID=A0ACB9M6I6_9MYRT|nr:hypothetical protein MLD38_033433 [Melastoma candidum]